MRDCTEHARQRSFLREAAVVGLVLLASTVARAEVECHAPNVAGRGTAVWTDVGLISGMAGGSEAPVARYEPWTDRWFSIPDPPTSLPGYGCVVWTGQEVLIWGEGSSSRSWRYDVRAATWREMAEWGEPSPRSLYAAVWTGDSMIIWGGDARQADGARYDPVNDRWSPVSSGPPPPFFNVAAWTGSEMLVWGGTWDGITPSDAGARYHPASDSWTPMSSAGSPGAMMGHGGAWTGSELFVFGETGSAGLYDPGADRWRGTTSAGAPSARWDASVVWTGSQAIVWGGSVGTTNVADGGVYDPATDAWRETTLVGAPDGRYEHQEFWTGKEMIIWGGQYDLQIYGARYDPRSDVWMPISDGDPYPTEGRSPGEWTGTLAIFPSTYEGRLYDPQVDRFRKMAADPTVPGLSSGVWTGSELLLWGSSESNEGRRYDIATDTWRPMSTGPGAPPPLSAYRPVWTGREMIVWGGLDVAGARYDPVSDSWQPMTAVGAPTARWAHATVWADTAMILWGGYAAGVELDDGGRYDPVADSWQPVSVGPNHPSARMGPLAVWTGSEMIVWGGELDNHPLGDGARYRPAGDFWLSMSGSAAPSPRTGSAFVWTGEELIVWGGDAGTPTDTGAVYRPDIDAWRPMALPAPSPRRSSGAVWTGTHMLMWGGYPSLLSGGLYDPVQDLWSCPPAEAPGPLVVVGKGAGPDAFHDQGLRSYRLQGVATEPMLDAFPTLSGYGSHATAGDLAGTQSDLLLVTPGPGPTHPPELRGFEADGLPVAGLDVVLYGSSGFGARCATGAVDGAQDRVLTAPGPAPALGPHIRGFRYSIGAVTPIAKVSFYAYGTLRYGARVGATDLDGDGFDEILTGAGGGSPFGPHVRGFDFDGGTLQPIPRLSFFAYGTVHNGVEVGAGDTEGDGSGEILTGPGSSPAFAAHLRGFDADGGAPHAIPRLDAIVFAGARYGLHVAAGDIDRDGRDEIVCGGGPDPDGGSNLAAFDDDGAGLSPIAGLRQDIWGLGYGLTVAVSSRGF